MFSSGLKRVLFYIALYGLVFIAFYFLFWRSSINKIEREDKKIDQIEITLAQTKSYISDWPVTFEKDLQKAENELKDFLARIPDKEEIPDILREIHKAKLNIISIENMTPKKEYKKEPSKKREKGKYDKSIYELKANGNYFDIIKFLRNLETMERLVNIENFNLNSSTGVDDSVDLNLTFSIFYSKTSN